MNRTPAILTALLTILVLAPSAQAQIGQSQELQTSFMMLNQHVCPPQNMEQVMDFARQQLAPALAQMKAAGEISEWGILTHAWGDEYNFNFYLITADIDRFVSTAWPSLVARTTELDPDWYDRFAPLCTMHKDNLYTVHSDGG